MSKKMVAFRFDPTTIEHLKYHADRLGLSQAGLLESLIALIPDMNLEPMVVEPPRAPAPTRLRIAPAPGHARPRAR